MKPASQAPFGMMFLMERQTVFLTGLVLRILVKIARMQNQQNGLLISERV